jgi:hypothetical protein
MKKFKVTSWETMEYYKIVEAKNANEALNKVDISTEPWQECYDNAERTDIEVDEYNE